MSPAPLVAVPSPAHQSPRRAGVQIPAAEVAPMRGIVVGLACALALWMLIAAGLLLLV